MRRTRSKLYVAVGIASASAAYLLGAAAHRGARRSGSSRRCVLAGAPRFLLATVIGARTPGRPRATAAGDVGHRVRGLCRADRQVMRSAGHHDAADRRLGCRPHRRARPDRLAIQCKRHARPVGAGAVQEVVAGAPMQDARRPWWSRTTNSPLPHVNSRSCTAANWSAVRELPRLRVDHPAATAPTPSLKHPPHSVDGGVELARDTVSAGRNRTRRDRWPA